MIRIRNKKKKLLTPKQRSTGTWVDRALLPAVLVTFASSTCRVGIFCCQKYDHQLTLAIAHTTRYKAVYILPPRIHTTLGGDVVPPELFSSRVEEEGKVVSPDSKREVG